MLDPWESPNASSSISSCGVICDQTLLTQSAAFEDNFCNYSSEKSNTEKLADSAEYLSILERKLARLKSNSTTNPKSISRELVAGISALRSDRMTTFLNSRKDSDANYNGNTGTSIAPQDSNYTESDPVYSSWLMHRLFPDRQALSEEELAVLIQFDALQKADGHLDVTPNQNEHKSMISVSEYAVSGNPISDENDQNPDKTFASNSAS